MQLRSDSTGKAQEPEGYAGVVGGLMEMPQFVQSESRVAATTSSPPGTRLHQQAPSNAVTPPSIVLHVSLEPEYMPTTSDLPRALEPPRAPRPSLP